jgi:hypothetical protein
MLLLVAEKTIYFGRVVAIYSFYFVHVDGNFIFVSFTVILTPPSVSLYMLALQICIFTHIFTHHTKHVIYIQLFNAYISNQRDVTFSSFLLLFL